MPENTKKPLKTPHITIRPQEVQYTTSLGNDSGYQFIVVSFRGRLPRVKGWYQTIDRSGPIVFPKIDPIAFDIEELKSYIDDATERLGK